MKKFLSLFFLLCLSIQIVSAKTYNIDQNQGELTIKKRDKIVIKLHANATTGYMWKINVENPDGVEVLKTKKEEYFVPELNLVGAPGILKYIVKAKNKGDARITGAYIRPWEKNKGADSFILNVKVKWGKLWF